MERRRREVLVIGGEADLRAAIGDAASQEGFGTRNAEGLASGLKSLVGGAYAATFLWVDAREPDLALVRRVAEEPSAGALVLTTSRPTPRLAIEAVQAGAADVIGSPVDGERLRSLLRSLGGAAEGAPVPVPADVDPEELLIGSSAALLEVFKGVGRVGPSAATVLITGESGTGKELVAQAIHRASPRAHGSFVAVNCAAIPEDLLESELFGHERGAFTGAVARKRGRFERAHGGTLFLDEIGDMSMVLQAKILRALQEREIERLGGEERIAVDVRVIAATHRDLPALIGAGEFREDLFYRLAVVRLHLPPLRERGDDVRDLALRFAGEFAREHGRAIRGVSEGALERLSAHPWPGNVRELRNVVERAVLVATGDTLLPEHIDLGGPARSAAPSPSATLPGYSPDLAMTEVEALHIAQVLRSVGGHFGRAAEVLGMHRNTVSRKAREYGLQGEDS